MIPKHKLKQLKASVLGNYGDVAKLADVSVETVSKVLNGHWMNEKVINAAISVRDENAQKMQQLADKI